MSIQRIPLSSAGTAGGMMNRDTGRGIAKPPRWAKEAGPKNSYSMIPFTWRSRPGKTNLCERNQNSGCLWIGVGGVGDWRGGSTRKLLGMMEMLCILIAVWVTQPYAFVKIHQTITLKICAFHRMPLYINQSQCFKKPHKIRLSHYSAHYISMSPHLFRQWLLSTNYMPGTVLGTMDPAENRD